MDKHITIIGVLHILFGVLGLLIAGAIFVFFSGIGFVADDENAFAILTFLGTMIAIVLVVFSIPGIFGGVWLMKRKEWARILILILAFLNLLNIPFGTILGGYTIWALLNSETVKLFAPPAPAPPAPAA